MESRFQKKEGFCIFGVKGKIRFMKKEEMENLKGLDLKELINLYEIRAKNENDGHMTIMRFTTGWKVMLGTPNLDIDGREEVWKLQTFSNLKDALVNLLMK